MRQENISWTNTKTLHLIVQINNHILTVLYRKGVFLVQYANEGSISISTLGFAASFQPNVSLDNCLLVLKYL
jgi:hypothetical protein